MSSPRRAPRHPALLSHVPPLCIQEEAATVSDPNVNDAIEPVESVEDELDTVEGADSEDTET
ncbi:transcription termination/antitermination protein NusG, partial [Streptomyces sp. NPDC056948]